VSVRNMRTTKEEYWVNASRSSSSSSLRLSEIKAH